MLTESDIFITIFLRL